MVKICKSISHIWFLRAVYGRQFQNLSLDPPFPFTRSSSQTSVEVTQCGREVGRRGRQETDVIWQLMYSQTLPIGPTRDHPQKVNLTSLFVLWPSDCCCCCPHIDLIHRTMWQQGKEQQVWKGNLFLIWTCERVHSFVVINCQRCMTDFYSGNTQQWGSIRGEGRSLPYSIIASVVRPKENQKKEKLLQFLELVTKELFLFEPTLACLVCAGTNEGYTILWHRRHSPSHRRQSTSNIFLSSKVFQ